MVSVAALWWRLGSGVHRVIAGGALEVVRGFLDRGELVQAAAGFDDLLLDV